MIAQEQRMMTPEPTENLRPLQVAILVEFDDTWGRNVVEAIARFAQDANWRLLFAPRDSERRLRVPTGWRSDGVIASLRDRSLIDHVKGLQTPAVDVSAMFPEERWVGRVATDDLGRARMALEHFRSRQLQHFASYAPSIGRYPDRRAAVFRDLVESSGFECKEFGSKDPSLATEQRNALSTWLQSLPRPVGIFASDPYPARQLAEVCVEGDIDVPSDVAILSGDEDDLLCGIMSPQITSVELASHRIGYEAASMLNEMMTRSYVPDEPKLIDPLRVCARRSTDYLAIEDPELTTLVRMIWEQAASGIQVSDLVRAAAMSRRRLEQRFREVLGHTPAEEIRRVKVEQARQMIVTTSKSIATIALSCGFSNGPYLAHAFRKHYGISPSDLRVGRSDPQAGPAVASS